MLNLLCIVYKVIDIRKGMSNTGIEADPRQSHSKRVTFYCNGSNKQHFSRACS